MRSLKRVSKSISFVFFAIILGCLPKRVKVEKKFKGFFLSGKMVVEEKVSKKKRECKLSVIYRDPHLLKIDFHSHAFMIATVLVKGRDVRCYLYEEKRVYKGNTEGGIPKIFPYPISELIDEFFLKKNSGAFKKMGKNETISLGDFALRRKISITEGDIVINFTFYSAKVIEISNSEFNLNFGEGA